MPSTFFDSGSSSQSTDSTGAQAPTLNNVSDSNKLSNPTGANAGAQQPTTGGGGGGAAPSAATPTAAPTSGAGAQSGAAPANAADQAQAAAPVSFASWLGANQQGAQNQTTALVNSANTTGSAVTSAAQGLTDSTDSALTNTQTASSLTLPTYSSYLAPTGRNGVVKPQGGLTAASGVVPTASQPTTSSATSTTPPGSLYNSDAAGQITAADNQTYGGPTASSISSSNQAAQLKAAQDKAAATQQALKNNGSQANGWDSAAAKASDTRGQVLNAQGQLTTTNSAGTQAQQDATGQAQGAQTAFNTVVGQNLAQTDQIAQQGAATASANTDSAKSTATAATAALGQLAATLSSHANAGNAETVSSDISQVDSAIQQYEPYLQSLGVSQADIATVMQDVDNHSYSPSAAVAWLTSQIQAGVPAYTGYDTNAAAVQNAANAALKKGATTVSTTSFADTGVTGSAGITAQATQDTAAVSQAIQQAVEQHEDISAYIKTLAGSPTGSTAGDFMGKNGNFAPIDNIVGYLSANGMTLPEISAELGLDQAASLALTLHYSNTPALQQTYSADEGVAYNPNASGPNNGSKLYGSNLTE